MYKGKNKTNIAWAISNKRLIYTIPYNLNPVKW